MPVLTSTAELHADNYQFLQRHVYAETGIVLEEDKHYLFECRLVPIVRRLGLKTIDDLCGLLQSSQSSDVSRQVVEAMTTNETYFFPRPRPIRCNSDPPASAVDQRKGGHQKIAVLVGRILDRTGSI